MNTYNIDTRPCQRLGTSKSRANGKESLRTLGSSLPSMDDVE